MALLIGIIAACAIPVGIFLLILAFSIVVTIVVGIVELLLAPFVFILSLFKRKSKRGV
mgnify:CR=1 FL=1